MIIAIITLYENEDYKYKYIKVSNDWLVILEKSENEIFIKSPVGEVLYSFKTKGLIKYEITKEKIVEKEEE